MPQTQSATPAIAAVDAIDHLDRPISALRAVEALTTPWRTDSLSNGENALPNLNRSDLGSLLQLVVDDLEQRRYAAAEAAKAAVAFNQSLSQPVVTKGATA